MANVYTVSHLSSDDYIEVVAIFSTEEKAIAYVERLGYIAETQRDGSRIWRDRNSAWMSIDTEPLNPEPRERSIWPAGH